MTTYELKHRECRRWYRRESHKTILVVESGGPVRVKWVKCGGVTIQNSITLQQGDMVEIPPRNWYGYEALQPARLYEEAGAADYDSGRMWQDENTVGLRW